MQTLTNLSDLWQRYFLEPSQINNADVWSIVYMARDDKQLLVSLANPFTEERQEIFIKNVTKSDGQMFAQHYKQRFLEQLPAHFGFFRPGVDHVLTEYPSWQTFYTAWLNNNVTLVQGNLPLLLDYPSAAEYRVMQLKEADYAGYRRLLVVLYQYRKQQFQKIFIKGIDDASFEQVKQQISELYLKVMPHLIFQETND